jgi:hypothetical protein
MRLPLPPTQLRASGRRQAVALQLQQQQQQQQQGCTCAQVADPAPRSLLLRM